MRRRPLAALRFAVLTLLVAAPAFAQPPHSPDDQYESFDRNDSIIVDSRTKLTWDRSAAPKTEDWPTAADYCRRTFQGRLPTIKELLTLLDETPHPEYDDGDLVDVLIDPDAFGGYRTPVDAAYWTSTPANPDGSLVWSLDFKSGDGSQPGEMRKEPKLSAKLRFRCVRPG
jgi:Protein of unknown function (DUF1566)